MDLSSKILALFVVFPMYIGQDRTDIAFDRSKIV